MQTNTQMFSDIHSWISDLSDIYKESEETVKERKIRRQVDMKNFKEAEVVQFEEIQV